MQIDQSSFFLAGNVLAPTAVLRATSAEAAGQVVDPEGIRRLRRALAFIRPVVLNFAGWRRLRRSETAWPAAAVAEVMALMVQRYVGWPVAYTAYRPSEVTNDEENVPQSRQEQGTALFQSTNEQIGLAAASAGFTVAQALLDDVEGPELRRVVRAALRGFLNLTLPATPSADALLLARIAGERGIPWQVVGRSRYLRIGLGRHSRILRGTESTLTSPIGVAMARDKSMSNRLLAEAGLPVPKQRTARTEEAAIAAGQELGYPLVVKPINGNMGRDVTIGVSSDDAMRAAFARAVNDSDRAVIETLIPGEETRLLVASGKFLAAMRREPAQVTGDGTHSVAELVREENRRPERDPLLKGALVLLKPLRLDEDALSLLAQQGLTADSVPRVGQKVFLRRESNISRGGTAVDVTDELHPSIIQLAEAASRTLRLDVCGVDFVSTDLSRPWQETGGAICEVNSRPGVYMQILAAPEERRDLILEAIFNALMGEGEYRGLPVVVLVGGSASTGRLRQRLETLAQEAGRKLGIVGEATDLAASSRPLQTTADLFKADDIDGALILMRSRDLLEQGLGLPRIAAAVIPPDLATRAPGLRRLVNRVTGGKVLATDDPAALERAAAALDLPTSLPGDRRTRNPAVLRQR